MIKLILKCNCGLNKEYDADENNISWNEDETCDCPNCGSKLRNNGWNTPVIGTHTLKK